MNILDPPAFPAGKYTSPVSVDRNAELEWIESLRCFPELLRAEVTELSESQLNLKYRNWTIRQIVHHLADSHVNCYVRFKWALTEATPTIKAYDESRWSNLVDATTAPIELSLAILQSIHERWAWLIAHLSEEELACGFFHPELDAVVKLREALPSYVWHGQHHLAQIQWVKQHRL